MCPESHQEVSPGPLADEVGVTVLDGGVAIVELRRPPNNFFDAYLIEQLAETFAELDSRTDARAIVLAASGKHFCAGADFAGESDAAEVLADEGARRLYAAAARLFVNTLPVIAAVQGAAIGGGLGLAMVGDFRVSSPESRFAANFARLGLHHGFGLSVTLPRVVGQQHAAELLMTGRRIDGREAGRIGLVDHSWTRIPSGPVRSSSRKRSQPRLRWPCAASERRSAGTWQTRSCGQPNTSVPNKPGCAQQKISPKASGRRLNVANRSFEAR